ncbi:HEPN-associated N-terminal domain-containing protein [Aeromonas hydrophila]|uniref:HEPN-associated N-terminal domain-containing protein n=2 Tax=Aeromonas TaxID=642 RepID=UPI001117A9F7|nr:HEPN-associated N-terminal domain-containing protein [Aeromonas hydrophila]
MDDKIKIGNTKVRLSSLKYKSKATQIELMREWFYENYEDPANSCPFESREGGYQYIYGGPYSASEVLGDLFDSYVKENYIEDLVDDLNSECWEWSANSSNIEGWYDEELYDSSYYDAVINSSSPYQSYKDSIDSITSLIKLKAKGDDATYMFGLLHTNIITTLEAFLSEMFINLLNIDDKFVANLLLHGHSFKDERILKANLFHSEDEIKKQKDKILEEVKTHLVNNINWHNIKVVMKLYEITCQFKPSTELSLIFKSVTQRHDFVHRNGKDSSGKKITIKKDDIHALIECVTTFVDEINDHIVKLQDEHKPKQPYLGFPLGTGFNLAVPPLPDNYDF